jgi:16S rRNA (cytosine1402-N4)-methyltransferase
MSEQFTHRPVLLDECIEALNIKPDGIYLDGTLGRAGHSRQIVRRLTTGRLICVDRDDAALAAARDRLAEWMDRVTLVHSNFSQVDTILDDLGLTGVDGMLFDLGVSSPQLDDASRGFSYMADAPLDMRMDRSEGLTAADVVNTWSREELRRILSQYGEERYSPQIAAAIVRRREDKPITTTLELVDVIKSAMPARALKEKQHPAKRSFQAIRIAVNDELSSVDRMIQAAVPRLNKGGRLAVITFHSLEDRIVKNGMAAFAKGCTCPPDFPVCVCGKTPDVKLVSRKPILPTQQEIEENPRARSAKLRVAEKLKEPTVPGCVGSEL